MNKKLVIILFLLLNISNNAFSKQNQEVDKNTKFNLVKHNDLVSTINSYITNNIDLKDSFVTE